MYKSICSLKPINIVRSCRDVQWIEKHTEFLFNTYFFIINIHQGTESQKNSNFRQYFSMLIFMIIVKSSNNSKKVKVLLGFFGVDKKQRV